MNSIFLEHAFPNGAYSIVQTGALALSLLIWTMAAVVGNAGYKVIRSDEQTAGVKYDQLTDSQDERIGVSEAFCFQL